MGNRFFNERGGPHVTFSQKWRSAGTGRYMKRRLGKARRKYIKHVLRGQRYRYPTALEREVNYKTW